MPNFMLSYHGGNKPTSPEEGAKHMAEWKAWVGKLGDAVVNPGTPLGKSMSVSSAGVAEGGGANPMSGFSIVAAESMAAALEIAQSCPFLETQGTIIVSEIMQM